MTSKSSLRWAVTAFSAAVLAASCFPVRALDGMIGIHDPSTVVKCDGNYYVFGTGRGISLLTSSNGFDWQRIGPVIDQVPESVLKFAPANNGLLVWAPDVIKVGDRYFLYYAVSAWNVFVSAVGLMTNSTLDVNSPNYKWTDCGMVVHSSKGENLNAIDPGVCLAPDGTLWLCYGSYHGNIELVKLNPKTGLRVSTNSPATVIASQSEAADIIHHGNYFYLFVNHDSCCQGSNSTYNIRVGRAKKITGPYLDDYGDNMLGGGRLFLAARGNDIGPGHFGLLLDDGMEKFSCHYEAEIGRKMEEGRRGPSILDIRPLLWTFDGWPMPGDNIRDGTYQIRSLRTGTILQASTNQTSVQTGRYLSRDHQKWVITPAGGGFYKILNTQYGNALTANGVAANTALFTNADNQLWKIDQLTDSTYRMVSKTEKTALAAVVKRPRGNGVTLEPFTGSDTQRWQIITP
jgi:arabinan endo-1,5-alpha-L-arabinosidase